MSWLLQSDVDEGRGKLNFSEWNHPQRRGGEAAKSVQKGDMPPWYVAVHPDARLTRSEQAALVSSLAATFGTSRSEGSHAKDD